MRERSIFRIILNGTAWSFLGVLLTIVFFYWTEYRNPFDLRILIEDDFDLVQVREKIADLRILYKGEDLLSSHKKIKVITITLRNDGKTILQQDFDQVQPFGLTLKGGTFLSAEPIASNSPYLQANFVDSSRGIKTGGDTVQSSSEIYFRKLIFEKNKFITLKLYALQSNLASNLELLPTGKIANIDSLIITRKSQVNDDQRTSLLTFLLYFGIGYISLVPLAFLLAFSYEKFRRLKRSKAIQAFQSGHPELTTDQRLIVDLYRRGWPFIYNRVIRELSKGNTIVDLRVLVRPYIPDNKPSNLILAWMPYRRIELSLIDLPKEIFEVSGSNVALNSINKDFILEFFSSVGKI